MEGKVKQTKAQKFRENAIFEPNLVAILFVNN